MRHEREERGDEREMGQEREERGEGGEGEGEDEREMGDEKEMGYEREREGGREREDEREFYHYGCPVNLCVLIIQVPLQIVVLLLAWSRSSIRYCISSNAFSRFFSSSSPISPCPCPCPTPTGMWACIV